MSRKLNFFNIAKSKCLSVTKYEFYYVAGTELCNVAVTEYFNDTKS